MRLPANYPSALLAPVLGIALLSGCDFFKELKSADSATEGDGETEGDTDAGTAGGTDAGTDTDGGPCTLLDDDFCADQDTLFSCSLDSGEVAVYDCGLLCGGYLNFTCLNSGTGQHACWCVEAGKQKVYSCSELEDCLQGCGNAIGDTCTNQCFSRATEPTIRMYGAVVHCAHASCEPLCKDDPAGCLACLDAAMAGQAAGCAIERSVCEADQNDEWGP